MNGNIKISKYIYIFLLSRFNVKDDQKRLNLITIIIQQQITVNPTVASPPLTLLVLGIFWRFLPLGKFHFSIDNFYFCAREKGKMRDTKVTLSVVKIQKYIKKYINT